MENFFEREQQIFWKRLFRRIFLEDWLMKLIALVITLGLWLGITGLRPPISRRFTNVPLNLRVSNDLEVTNSPVTEITLIISGDKGKVDQMKQDDLVVSLDLSEVQPGERVVPIAPENVNIELPAGVRLESVSPSIIPIRIERVIERDVPVKAETEGGVAEGFEVYATVTTPSTVRVSGPESFVRPLDSISTEKIGVEAKREDFTAQQVPLNVVNPKVRLVDTTVADVTFRIGERRVERTFTVTAKTETGERRVSVRLYGAASLLENLTAEDIRVEIVKNEAGETIQNIILPPEIQNRVEIRDRRSVQ